MSNTYEKSAATNLDRLSKDLVLLGARADADIAHRDQKIAVLTAELAELRNSTAPKWRGLGDGGYDEF